MPVPLNRHVPTIRQQGPRPPVETGSVLDRLAALGQGLTEGATFLIYGSSGTGKTTLWSTFPAPILAVLCSAGRRPGELRSINTPANRNRIRQVVLHEAEELALLAARIQQGGQGWGYETVVLDHVTAFQDMVLAEVLGLTELPEQKGWGLATQQQYGACTLRCKKLLRKLVDLPCNVVLVAQERTFDAEGESSSILQPHVNAAVTASLAGWLNYACDYVAQCYVRAREEVTSQTVGEGKNARKVERRRRTDEPEFCLRVRQDGVYKAKFRVPGGLKVGSIVNPTYEKIIGLIQGG